MVVFWKLARDLVDYEPLYKKAVLRNTSTETFRAELLALAGAEIVINSNSIQGIVESLALSILH